MRQIKQRRVSGDNKRDHHDGGEKDRERLQPRQADGAPHQQHNHEGEGPRHIVQRQPAAQQRDAEGRQAFGQQARAAMTQQVARFKQQPERHQRERADGFR